MRASGTVGGYAQSHAVGRLDNLAKRRVDKGSQRRRFIGSISISNGIGINSGGNSAGGVSVVGF